MSNFITFLHFSFLTCSMILNVDLGTSRQIYGLSRRDEQTPEGRISMVSLPKGLWVIWGAFSEMSAVRKCKIATLKVDLGMLWQINGPYQSTSFCLLALDMTHDSSVAHLRPIFGQFFGKARPPRQIPQ